MPITNFMMSRASLEEVKMILRAMDLVAMDLQQEIVIGA
jgi:hypothetical protein